MFKNRLSRPEISREMQTSKGDISPGSKRFNNSSGNSVTFRYGEPCNTF